MPLKVIRGGALAETLAEAEQPAKPIDPSAEPSSHEREKRKPSEASALLLASMRTRTEGLSGAELEAEIDLFVTKMIEHHAKAAPEGPLRDELRDAMRNMIENDPAFVAVVRELKR